MGFIKEGGQAEKMSSHRSFIKQFCGEFDTDNDSRIGDKENDCKSNSEVYLRSARIETFRMISESMAKAKVVTRFSLSGVENKRTHGCAGS